MKQYFQLTDKHDVIIAYLNQTLTGAEFRAFQADLVQNPTLQAEVAQIKSLRFALQHYKEWQDISQKIAAETTTLPFYLQGKTWWSVAASLLVLFVGTWLLRTPQNENLYEQFASKELPIYAEATSPVGGTEYDQEQQIFRLYKTQKFAQAIPLLEKLKKEVADNQQYYVYQAYCYTQNRQFAEAKKNWKYLAQNGYTHYEQQAHWELTLLYLKENQADSAKLQLQPLLTQENKYQAKAKELREKMTK